MRLSSPEACRPHKSELGIRLISSHSGESYQEESLSDRTRPKEKW